MSMSQSSADLIGGSNPGIAEQGCQCIVQAGRTSFQDNLSFSPRREPRFANQVEDSLLFETKLLKSAARIR